MSHQPNFEHPNFDRIARIYRWAEYATFGPILQQTRTHFLPQLKDRHHALILGDGDGRFLTRLLAQNPTLHALAVDTSATMLHLLQQRCPTAQTLQANALHLGCAIAIPTSTDLITTHFFLDCLTQPEVETLTHRIAAATQPGTLWLLSDFAIPTNPLAPIARLYIQSLYLAFRILTSLRTTHLPNPQQSLANAGFTLLHRHQRLFGLIYTEIWRRD